MYFSFLSILYIRFTFEDLILSYELIAWLGFRYWWVFAIGAFLALSGGGGENGGQS
jgi:hypothetical protein